MTKTCSHCKTDKPVVNFSWHKKENKYRAWCNACVTQNSKERNRKIHERRLANGRIGGQTTK